MPRCRGTDIATNFVPVTPESVGVTLAGLVVVAGGFDCTKIVAGEIRDRTRADNHVA